MGGEEFNVCKIQITYDNPENLEFSVELPLEDKKFISLQEQDLKIQELHKKLEMVYTKNFIVLTVMFCSDAL